MADLQTIRNTVQEHGQQHLLRFYDKLAEPEQTALLEQLSAIDWGRIDEYAQNYVLNPPAFKRRPRSRRLKLSPPTQTESPTRSFRP